MQERIVSKVAGMSPRQTAKGPENDEGEDGYVHPGNDQDVIGTGALEIDSRVAVDEGLFANHNGVDESGLGGRPEGVDFGDDAGVNAASPAFYASSSKAGEHLYLFGVRGPKRGDADCGQIALVVEGSGIAEIARQLQLDGKPEAFAVAEKVHGRRGCLVGVQ